jgi:hypothetical protein
VNFLHGVAVGGIIVCLLAAVLVAGIAFMRYVDENPLIASEVDVAASAMWLAFLFIVFCGFAAL